MKNKTRMTTCYVVCVRYACPECEHCVFTLCMFGALKMNKETEWTLAKLCVYAMETLKVNTCYVVCVYSVNILRMKNETRVNTCYVVYVRYTSPKDEHLRCCVFTLRMFGALSWTRKQNEHLLRRVYTLWRHWRWRARPEWTLAMLCILGDSGGVVISLDFCPASFKSLGCFYFRCVLSSQWKDSSDSEFANFTLPTLKAFLEARSQNVSSNKQ